MSGRQSPRHASVARRLTRRILACVAVVVFLTLLVVGAIATLALIKSGSVEYDGDPLRLFGRR